MTHVATREKRTSNAERVKVSALRFSVGLLVTGTILASTAFADVSLVSVTSEGIKGNGQSTRPDVSGDGRYVVFGSSATTLRPGSNLQTVVKDMVSGSINLISKAPDDTPGDAPSTFPMTISSDGRYVAFPSYASNLVAGDSAGSLDLFWHDQSSGVTKMVNVAPDGSRGNGSASFAAISGNGRYVAFRSTATDLTTDTVSGYQVYVRDMLAESTRLVSRNASGSPQGGGEPDIDNNGRWVSYRGAPGSSVWAADTWNCSSTACTVLRVDLDNSGNPVPGHTSVLFPKISGDGNFVTWESNAVGYVEGDTNGQADIFVRDLTLSQTFRVSIASDGSQTDGFSYTPDISDDGRYVSFTSNASNLATADANMSIDVFVHDRQTGETVRVSETDSGGDANAGADFYARIAGNGLAVAFDTNSTDLVPEDSDSTEDVYLASLAPPNQQPVAEAGNDQAAPVGSQVNLTGIASSDDSTPTIQLEFEWTIVSAPSGSTAVITDNDAAIPSLVPDMPGIYEISLVVTDEYDLSSVPDNVFITAELLPAFVFERVNSGGGSYESLYDRDDYYWSYLSDSEYWRPAALQGGAVLGTKYAYQYQNDSISGTYSQDWMYGIGKLSELGEEIYVSTDDAIPGGDGETFQWIYLDGVDGDTVYFRGYGPSYDYNNAQYQVDLTSEPVSAEPEFSLPLSITNEDDSLERVWRGAYSFRSGQRFYTGSNGTCPYVRNYTNYYGYTYSYCVRHIGLYTVDSGVATRIVDNMMQVPGGGPDDYFYSFRSAAYDEDSGDFYFISYWFDVADSKYHQGVFRVDESGTITKMLDDESLDWDRGWFDSIRFQDGHLYAGGRRYESGYELGKWWSSSQQGIFRISESEVEPLVTGGYSYWHQSNWYDGYSYAYMNSSVETWNFQVEGSVLAYGRYLYAYDSNSNLRDYDEGVFWWENGIERRVAGTNDEILDVAYDGAYPGYNGDWLEGRSLVLNGWQYSEYTSEYDEVEDQYYYSNSWIRDVLIARFDTDRDGIGDDVDNCRERPNADQFDSDLNGIGDVCEDSDADTVVDHLDNCPLVWNPDQDNSDPDPFGDACDVCPFVEDDQSDIDSDGDGDACDNNSDFDSLVDADDNCPYISNEDQSNLDVDKLGDVCDPDVDGDGIDNEVDGEWTGTEFVDESLVDSNNFSDHSLGGHSYGRIVNRGQLIVLISDAPDSDRGVLINAVNGTGSSLVRQCDYRGQEAKLDLQQGTIAIVDCGSIAVETIANLTQIILDTYIAISVPAQVAARVIDVSDKGFVVANESDAPLPLRVNLDTSLVVTLPDGSVGEIEETAPGQFEIQNRPESTQSITVEANGNTIIYQPGDSGIPVTIDIKPNSDENSINLGSNGVIPVAILSDGSFDATEIDPLTVSLASSEVRLKGKGTPATQTDDVNGDGLMDLVVQVETENLVLQATDSTAKLTGLTYAGLKFIGEDLVTIVNQ